MKRHLLDYFEETVANRVEAVAVRHNEQSISFSGLRVKAQKLGSFLIYSGYRHHVFLQSFHEPGYKNAQRKDYEYL